MREVRLLATGGTIASRSGAGGRVVGAGGDELLSRAAVPRGVEVSVVDAAGKPSFAWRSAEVMGLLGEIGAALDEGVDGIVVTHGTDTMEEVAFLAGLVHDDPRPVVFTGAQRPFDDPAPDGPANLTDALAVAADERAARRGALVVFDGHAYAAHGVTKVDTTGAHAFDAPGRGPVLRVAGGHVLPLAPPCPPPVLPVDRTRPDLPRVDVVPLYLGADAALLRAAVRAGARGLVLSAFGAGNANPDIVEAVGEVVAGGTPVLVCSRVLSGPVLALYGAGGGADLARAGAVFGADLTAWQGRMLLAAALACEQRDPAASVRQWLGASSAGAVADR